jgi:hypothetical protein
MFNLKLFNGTACFFHFHLFLLKGFAIFDAN